MNRMHIDPVRFINIRTGVETTGFVLYDDYVSIFGELESVPDDDKEFFKLVVDFAVNSSEGGRYVELWGAVVYLRENVHDVFIGNILYKYDDLKEIIDVAFEE